MIATPVYSMSPEPPVDNDGVGATLWLPRKTSTPAHVVCPKVADRNAAATIAIAGRELQESWQGGQVTLRLVSEGSDNDGYHIKYKAADHSAVVSARRPLGLLYGAYALLRWQETKEGGTTPTAVWNVAMRERASGNGSRSRKTA